MNFWDRTAPAAPAQQQGLGAAYREWCRQTSGSALYAEPVAPTSGRAPYVQNQYQGLTGYIKVPRSKFEPRDGESANDYLRRVDNPNNLLNMEAALPADEFERIKAAIETARAHVHEHGIGTHEQLRERLGEPMDIGTGGVKYGYHGSSVMGNGIGIMGSPGQRSAALDAARAGDARIPAAMSQVRAAIQAKEQAQRAQPVEHTDLSGMASSGEGWMTR